MIVYKYTKDCKFKILQEYFYKLIIIKQNE